MYRKNKNLLPAREAEKLQKTRTANRHQWERMVSGTEISVSIFDRARVGGLNEYFRSRKNIEPHPDRESMLEL